MAYLVNSVWDYLLEIELEDIKHEPFCIVTSRWPNQTSKAYRLVNMGKKIWQ